MWTEEADRTDVFWYGRVSGVADAQIHVLLKKTTTHVCLGRDYKEYIFSI